MQIQEDMPKQLFTVEEVGEDVARDLIKMGMATEQLIDGKKFIKINNDGFQDIADTVVEDPQRWSIQLWNEFVDHTDDIEDITLGEAIMIFAALHVNIKTLTCGVVDFTEVMHNAWLEEANGKL